MMTVNSIPENYPGQVRITIRDKDIHALARNWMILVFLFDNPIKPIVAEHIIHLWYSAFVLETTDDWVRVFIHHTLVELNEMIEKRRGYRKAINIDRIPTHSAANAWEPITMRTRSRIDLMLNYPTWSYLEKYVSPGKLSHRQGYLAREAVTACPSKLDVRERRLLKQPPPERLSYQRFVDSGVLLPFSELKYKYFKPNITLFDSSDDTNLKWRLDDNMSPERGWSRSKFTKALVGEVNNDIFGKLFYYLRDDVIPSFHKRMHRLEIQFNIEEIRTSHPAGDLPSYREYDRILVSSMDDPTNSIPKGFIGWLGGFLKPSNPYATLITPHNLTQRPPISINDKQPRRHFDEAFRGFLPEPCVDRPFNLCRFDARAVIRREIEQIGSEQEYKKLLEMILPSTHFAGDWDNYGIRQKKRNTITKRWPHCFPNSVFEDPTARKGFQDYVAEDRDPGLVYLE
ncbi:hypothetical protein F4776DRAFT_666757 [Hypoxylon sp. NC0597]|nr:hypothetical protein F4776DRAFT_666757 [Hypoxylon sp. NC0597]